MKKFKSAGPRPISKPSEDMTDLGSESLKKNEDIDDSQYLTQSSEDESLSFHDDNDYFEDRDEDKEVYIEKHNSQGFENNYKLFMKIGKAFLCPLPVLDDPELSDSAKRLFFKISSLSYNCGYCWATNDYLAAELKKSKSSIKVYLRELRRSGLIANEYIPIKHGDVRHIHLQFAAMRKRYLRNKKK